MKNIIRNIKIYFSEYLKNYKWVLVGIFLLLTLGLSITILLPFIVSILIDSIDSNTRKIMFTILPVIYLTLVFLKLIFEVINVFISERLGWTISNNLRENLVKHCLELDFSFYIKHKPGEMIERIDGDVSFLSNFFSEFFVNILGNTVFIFSVVVIFYLESGAIGIGYSLIIILAYCSILLLQNKIVKLWCKYREDEAQLYGYIQDSILAHEDVIGIGEENYLENKLKNFLNTLKKDFRNAVVVSNIPTSSFFGLLNIGDLVAIGIGIYLFYNSQLTLGSIYLISNYVGLLNRPFIALRYEFDNLQKIGASLKRISDLFEVPKKNDDEKNKFNKNYKSIEFQNVSFSYENNQIDVLTDINIDIKRGQKIGIVGKTGSGKTTLIKLLSKMYEPCRGKILLGDINIWDITTKSLYENLCMISQNTRIFNTTVLNNITSFESSPDTERILKVINQVGLGEWLQRLSNGLDTVISKEMLSAGQEQLLYICRAFFSNAEIFIFDEINSKLDYESEEKIFAALEKLTEKKTVIIIAHKLKILELVDKVLIMENGMVKVFDEREKIPNELIERNLEA
ncbi:ABC transporter ATP-binding protein [Blautia producta]|uniref:ABC transporter ATP-binding protein n=1 Tax=Blautia producta TaxID=33035 RepID=UPI002108841E|nr:ABC transporter ATP-binding protein [Blautia producta]MCQ4744243.1 ABC transporter ATP-binding protein/permease [Blautia producta]